MKFSTTRGEAMNHEWPRASHEAMAAVCCGWTENSEGLWDTGCGHVFIFTEGDPRENEFKYCCFCGGKLEQSSYSEQLEEDDND
jgi:hypothetical protein